MAEARPHAVDEDVGTEDAEQLLGDILRTTPGLAAISASLMYDDGRIERITMARPRGAQLSRAK